MAKVPSVKLPVEIVRKNRSRNCSCNSCQGEDVTVTIDQVNVPDPDRWLAEIEAMAARRASGTAPPAAVQPLGTISFRDGTLVSAADEQGNPVALPEEPKSKE